MVDSNPVCLCELLPVADDSFRRRHSRRLRPHARAPGDLPRRHPRCLHLHCHGVSRPRRPSRSAHARASVAHVSHGSLRGGPTVPWNTLGHIMNIIGEPTVASLNTNPPTIFLQRKQNISFQSIVKHQLLLSRPPNSRFLSLELRLMIFLLASYQIGGKIGLFGGGVVLVSAKLCSSWS